MPGNGGAPDPASDYCLIQFWHKMRQTKDYGSIGLAHYDYDAGAWYVFGHVPHNQGDGYLNELVYEITHWIYLHEVIKDLLS